VAQLCTDFESDLQLHLYSQKSLAHLITNTKAGFQTLSLNIDPYRRRYSDLMQKGFKGSSEHHEAIDSQNDPGSCLRNTAGGSVLASAMVHVQSNTWNPSVSSG
jgi:hypothetical protein